MAPRRRRNIADADTQSVINVDEIENDSETDENDREPSLKRRKCDEDKEFRLPRILDNPLFFEVIELTEVVGKPKERKALVRCTECSELKKGVTSSTGNFRSHYRRAHPNQFEKLKAYVENRSLETKETQRTLTSYIGCAKPEMVNTYIYHNELLQ